MFEVEKGIPIPAIESWRGGPDPRLYPFRFMEIGDSFLVPHDKAKLTRAAASLRKRRHSGWDYTTKMERDGMRLWRIA